MLNRRPVKMDHQKQNKRMGEIIGFLQAHSKTSLKLTHVSHKAGLEAF